MNLFCNYAYELHLHLFFDFLLFIRRAIRITLLKKTTTFIEEIISNNSKLLRVELDYKTYYFIQQEQNPPLKHTVSITELITF